ncbi:MAG: signal peptidase II [Acutalibacteraceae bacterium]|nr:signal peptidase II [Acutalibacteraceae bacterium]
MIISFVVAILIVVADQLIKLLVVNTIKGGETVTILNGLVKFIYCENEGMAFGLLQNFRWVFITFTCVVVVGVIIYILKVKPKSKFLLASLSLILGGGVGNLIDRIFLGYVIDYIQLSFFSPICNFADYCVTIGTAMLVIYILFFTQEDNTTKLKEKAEQNE